MASGSVILGMPASSKATPCRRSWYLRASEKATRAPMLWATSQYFGTLSAVKTVSSTNVRGQAADRLACTRSRASALLGWRHCSTPASVLGKMLREQIPLLHDVGGGGAAGLFWVVRHECVDNLPVGDLRKRNPLLEVVVPALR